MITEKGLAEKVMYRIHIGRRREVELAFEKYIEFIQRLGNKKDDRLHNKTCESYFDYVFEKIDEEKREGK